LSEIARRGTILQGQERSSLKTKLPALSAPPEQELESHRNLGKAFFENPTTHDEAIAEFKKALDLAPGSVREKLNYALALLHGNRVPEAVELLRAVQRRDPSLPHMWFNLGIYYKKAGEAEQALADGHGDFEVSYPALHDLATRSPIGRASLLSLTFGLIFFDYDLDGYPDLFAANGHIEEQIGRVQPKVQYEELPLLFHNESGGRFHPVPAFSKALVARGAANGDFDNDGGNSNHWLQIRLAGTMSNRDGIGAVVKVGKQTQTVHSGSSYCSSSDLALTFGLGSETSAASIDIYWPSGANQKMSGLKANQAHLEQIERINPRVNAVVEVLAESALEASRHPVSGPLSGVPFSIKDSIAVEGTVCSAGTLGYRDAPRSRRDATLVARLRAAGAIPLARTNLPDLLFAFESDNLLFGPPTIHTIIPRRPAACRAPAMCRRMGLDRSALANRPDGAARRGSVCVDAAAFGSRWRRHHGTAGPMASRPGSQRIRVPAAGYQPELRFGDAAPRLRRWRWSPGLPEIHRQRPNASATERVARKAGGLSYRCRRFRRAPRSTTERQPKTGASAASATP
jgi:hypothetical protein